MPTIDFGGCLANYWFVWALNGVGTLASLGVTMATSFFIMKYFHKIAGTSPSGPQKPASDFSNFRSDSPPSNMPIGARGNDNVMGNAFQTGRS